MRRADLDLAVPAIVFGAVGTAGQRCTTTRRVLVHESRRRRSWSGAWCTPTGRCASAIRSSRHPDGPADRRRARSSVIRPRSPRRARQGGELLYGGKVAAAGPGNFVEPAIVRARNEWPIVQTETFAPILYVIPVESLDEAIAAAERLARTACRRRSSPTGCRTRSASCRPPAATAASPTSTSAPRAPRSAAPSAARRTPAAGASRARMPGRPTCAARPTPINWSRELPLAQGIEFKVE